ncbi:hypothetical protein ALC53_02285 [Atta colombica]|uniref:Uncharacterized protein n=1 Tax=Atta colombica TaxID=520822 RepID=A0A195BR56_9HYME|nr:hypothetical protein ALC53_02285 [Atta colombica]
MPGPGCDKCKSEYAHKCLMDINREFDMTFPQLLLLLLFRGIIEAHSLQCFKRLINIIKLTANTNARIANAVTTARAAIPDARVIFILEMYGIARAVRSEGAVKLNEEKGRSTRKESK